MRNLFTKPIELLTSDDALSVVGWPESVLVEFKQELPSKQRGGVEWIKRGNIGEYAKVGIFKEIVALANTSGGHVVIGINENKTKPPIATGINPIPRCKELADRLEQAAQAIDPPIPLLLARGIPTESDGESGIVLFRVPASRNAPHRSIDKECYIRRGERSIPMSMREIREMTLTLINQNDIVRDRFRRSQGEMNDWFQDQRLTHGDPMPTGFRLTAIPIGSNFVLPRLFQKLEDIPIDRNYRVMVTDPHIGREIQLEATDFPISEAPILRGVRKFGQSGWTRLNLYSDGVVELGFKFTTYGVRWPPETGQVAKRESSLGAAGRPKVRHGQYSEETQR